MRSLVVLLCGVSLAFAQRGKISGTVIDGESKEPLTGVNIVLKGTTQGGATDVDGKYAILNVTPGTYTLVASMVGYNQVQITNVRVNIDRTTTIDITMQSSAVQLGAVVIEAKQPPVTKDKTATASTVEGRDIEKAPVEGLREVMELNAGMQKNPNGTFSLRGSGSYDINVMVNGVEQMTSSTSVPGFGALGDKANNSWKYDFNPLGVQQMEIISGGFSAEYGNAQAGVVKVVTREGGPKLQGQIRYEFRPPGQYHWGDYIYNTNSIEWKKWGTIEGWRNNPGMDSTSIVNTYLNDPKTGKVIDSLNGHPITVEEWRQLMLARWIQNHTPGEDNQLGVYDYRKNMYQRLLFSVGGPLGADANLLRFFFAGEYRYAPTRIPTAEQVQKYQNYTLTTIYQPTAVHKIRLTGIYQSYRGGIYSGSEDIRWAGYNGDYKYYLVTDSPRDEYTTTQSLNWTYTLSPKSFLDVMATHQFEKYILLEQPVPQRAANWRNNVYNDQWYITAGPWDEGYRTIYSFTTFNQQDLRTHQYNLTADFTNQFTASHDVKMGFRATYWDMHNSAVYSSFASNAFISRTGYAEYYKAYPRYIAGYVQDKMEFEGLVANVGVRVDAYNMNSPMPVDRFDPFYIAVGSEAIGNPETTTPETWVRVSPRLGLSFPIGEMTAFRLQYGHFSSMPIFSNAYTRTNELGWAAFGNPNLAPKRTINYEIGVQHSFGGTHRLDVVAYYNDRVSQIGGIKIYSPSAGIRRNKLYSSYDNNQFGASRGIEATFEKVSRGRWTYRITYSLSRTTYGNYGPTKLYSDDPNDPRNFQDAFAPTDYLSYDDRTHTLRTMLTYNVEANEGIEIFGVHPFERLSASLIYTAQSGSPYTYVPSYDELYKAYTNDQVTNNRRYPLEAKTDLNITKNLNLFGFEAILGVRIMNLFDNQWLTPLDYKTDQMRNWVEYGITMDRPITINNFDANKNPVVDYSQQIYKLNFFRAYRNMPRQVFFTLGFNF
ncbi:MAG: TonB-dependent receptor [Acidobacteriota bacterium]